MTATSSPTTNASSWSWVTKIAVASIALSMRRTSRRSSARNGASRLEKGSSSSITEGRGARARAMATRCACPPESVCTARSPNPARPTSSSASLTRSPRPGSRRGSPYATLRATVRWGKRAASWKTIPMRRRSAGTNAPGPDIMRPATRTSPPSGRSRPATARSSVVLPQPLGPRRATSDPAGTARSTPRSTRAAPNDLTSPATTTGSALAGRPSRMRNVWCLKGEHSVDLIAPHPPRGAAGRYSGRTYNPAAARSPITRSEPLTVTVSWPAAGSTRSTSTSVPGTRPCS